MDIANLTFYEIPNDLWKACIEQALEESSMGDLERSIARAFPLTTKRQHATQPIRPTTIKYVPFKGVRSLMVRSTVRGSTGKVYDPIVMYSGLTYEEEDTPTNVTFRGTDGKDYHMEPMSYDGTKVAVRCNCLDFYYRFAMWNHNDGSLFGRKPKLYRRKTTTRPSVNPEKAPGVCKHLIKLAGALKDAGVYG